MEPLYEKSALWDMENVLLSSHNADMTATFLHDGVRLFVDNMNNFLAGDEASTHLVDKKAGY